MSRGGYDRSRWADLLRRVIALDGLACPRCGSRMRGLATIEDPGGIRRIHPHPPGALERARAARPRSAASRVRHRSRRGHRRLTAGAARNAARQLAVTRRARARPVLGRGGSASICRCGVSPGAGGRPTGRGSWPGLRSGRRGGKPSAGLVPRRASWRLSFRPYRRLLPAARGRVGVPGRGHGPRSGGHRPHRDAPVGCPRPHRAGAPAPGDRAPGGVTRRSLRRGRWADCPGVLRRHGRPGPFPA